MSDFFNYSDMPDAKKKIEKKGRGGDKLIAHLTPGEIVIPRPFVEDLREILTQFFEAQGSDIQRYTVGNSKNITNPKTGFLEFFSLTPRTPEEVQARQKGKVARIRFPGIAGKTSFMASFMTAVYEHGKSGSKLGFREWYVGEVDTKYKSIYSPSPKKPSPPPRKRSVSLEPLKRGEREIANRRRGYLSTVMTRGARLGIAKTDKTTVLG